MFGVDWWAHGLLWGSVAALGAGAVLVAALFVAPYAFFNDYPEDVRSAATPPTARDRKIGLAVGLIFFVTLLGSIGAVVFTWGAANPGASFVELALLTLVAILLFVIVDIVLIDWLLICTLRPRAIVLDGTEDCAGWRDYGFHVREQFNLRGTSVLIIFSLVVGGLAWLVT